MRRMSQLYCTVKRFLNQISRISFLDTGVSKKPVWRTTYK